MSKKVQTNIKLTAFNNKEVAVLQHTVNYSLIQLLIINFCD